MCALMLPQEQEQKEMQLALQLSQEETTRLRAENELLEEQIRVRPLRLQHR